MNLPQEISPVENLRSYVSDQNQMLLLQDWMAYSTDALQRTVLFLDTLRERASSQEKMTAQPNSNVLHFHSEVVMRGSDLPRPISYMLMRIQPLDGHEVNFSLAPVVITDPRAGQGPGIGGFKLQSEIGEALRVGHPVYFIGFSGEPLPDETFLDVVEGQTLFIEQVVQMHPNAPRPITFGNCQAGYQTLMGAAVRPSIYGPCVVVGSPMSYWQGERGSGEVFPMRYSGGLFGGSWITALTSDLGANTFDGAWLVLNFDSLNPSNWLWDKQYQVYAKVDAEAERYLAFERWWGDFIVLNGQTMQYLVDELFIGDRLTQNQLSTNDGQVIDLRNVTSPIIVLTSLGDNISPVPQTVGWILDLYADEQAIKDAGRTIIYCINPHVGHLALFVSSSVAIKEDEEIMANMATIEQLPPGLYEMIIDACLDIDAHEARGDEYGVGRWKSRFEPRTFDEIRSFGRNSEQEDLAFATVAKLSERNLTSYKMYAQPWVRAWANPFVAKHLRQWHPLQLSYSLFSEQKNPMMALIPALAKQVKAHRQPASTENPFWRMQESFSQFLGSSLKQFQIGRDKAVENTFFTIFTNSYLQNALDVRLPKRSKRACTSHLNKEV